MMTEDRRQEAARAKTRSRDEGSETRQQVAVLGVGLSALLVLLLF